MQIHLVDIVAPVVVATLFIVATSAFKEPQRRNFNAIMIAGAGAAYLNGGLGIWEFAFTAVVTYCAYKGLNSYGFIGLGWLLHTGWDVMHHLYGSPLCLSSLPLPWDVPSVTPLSLRGVLLVHLPCTACEYQGTG